MPQAPVDIERVVPATTRVDDLLALRARWALEQGRDHQPGDLFEDEFRRWVIHESAHREFWIASAGGQPIGMVNLLMFDRMPTVGTPSGGWGYLCNMYVDQAHRNGGIGAQLASAVLDFADSKGLERVVLSPSERSRPFYASLGFQPAANLLLRPRP